MDMATVAEELCSTRQSVQRLAGFGVDWVVPQPVRKPAFRAMNPGRYLSVGVVFHWAHAAIFRFTIRTDVP